MTLEADRVVIGLISDTHGLVRPSVHVALEGVDLILHAGDVGGADVLTELRTIAPVLAVYGNTDLTGNPELMETLVVERGGVSVRVVHGHLLGPTPARLAASYAERVIVYGHTHRQRLTRVDGRLVVNPGAAGPRRFDLAPSVARLTIENGVPEVELVPVD